MCPDTTRRARGSVTVELALLLGIFLLFMLGTVEVARALYLLNTMQEVTRHVARGAAVTDFSRPEALAALRRTALFRDGFGDGPLPLVPNLGPDQVRIEYLTSAMVPVSPVPGCPQQNVRNCTLDPEGAGCIRFVRASICAGPAGGCDALPYQPLTGIVPGLAGFALPLSSTVQKAESLGYRPGLNACLTP